MALTRAQLIDKVKVKLDELTPYDSLGEFIADLDGDYAKVNPVESYIDSLLDDSATYCLNDLPMTLLADDVKTTTVGVGVNSKGVGSIDYTEYTRIVRVSVPTKWDRDVTSFITSSDPEYLKQQNKYTRGGCAKPVVAIVPDLNKLEFYSFTPTTSAIPATLYSIDPETSAEDINSPIDDYVALRCAAYVLETLNENDKAAALMAEYENKKKGIMI